MKAWNRPLLTLGLALILAFSVSAQSPTSYITADVFSHATCEEFIARSDAFFSFLRREPSGIGFVVIKGDQKYLRQKLTYENWWYGALNFRQFDGSRVTIIRAAETGSLEVQFLILPPGVGAPTDTALWNFNLPRGRKPFLYHDELEQICTTPKFGGSYKDFLEANPGAKGRIVIYAKSKASFLKAKTDAIAKVPAVNTNKLRFTYIRSAASFAHAEFWIVPPRR